MKTGLVKNNEDQNKLAAIVWAPGEVRTKTFAIYLNADLHNIHYLLYRQSWIAPIKYVMQWFRTWYILFKNKYSVIYVTNPPIVAALCVAIYCKFSKAEFVMDTHSPALFSRKWGWTVPLQRVVARSALVNVVDQERFKTLFESWQARVVVLENPPIPDTVVSLTNNVELDDSFSVTIINTFSEDEPLEPVLEAAKRLPDMQFYILGDTTLARTDVLHSAPENVSFPGYLTHSDYWNQLRRSHVLMVLTEYPYSLLGGAQEGMSIGKPLILSGQPILQEYFHKGAIFVENSTKGIMQGVLNARESQSRLQTEIKELAHEKRQEWYSRFENLRSLINETIG